MSEPKKNYKCKVCNQRLNEFNGKLVHPGFHGDHEPQPVEDPGDTATLVCDFCTSAHLAAWRYPAKPFTMAGLLIGKEKTTARLTVNSDSDWMACEECHKFIEEDDAVSLVIRAARLILAGRGVDVDKQSAYVGVIAQEIATLHQQFYDSRTGPPVPLREEQ